jgi:hypothetical protein
LMAPHHEAGGADALKIHVAAEIVRAGPHRRERPGCSRYNINQAYDKIELF